ncbi:helix-turn-helix transcriptional regulator [Mycolicibacterium fluoranthenivorans]|uniref:DNA-binding NarL/FixJ family response regulator n=1 Tax=Mycolicibacterium fluoranthenivorans TaxID=258505 RepID=A0A7X5TYC8_9MYCO|nr:LuxR C-terminal-related transcriptional regulator [Mycolicibacterium fluoranthenivorans]MCV7358886.1 response regulator transcription factor [Mycolicibacterium fluoranthenivorans]NIH95002.1 DNA-binding NarL/FixJ family response regulator [Mycolicibacterium fluoranthenivorans]
MAEDHRSHLSVVIVCPPTQRSHTSIYRWLEEVGAPATVSAVYTTLSDFLEGSPLSATTRIDLVLVARTCDDDDADIAATRRISSAGHRVILFGTTLLDDAVLHYLDAGAAAFVAGDRRPSGYTAVTTCTASELYAPASSPASVASPGLTHRESEVLIAWCHASTKEDVAERLAIERATVSSHLQRIRAKYAAVGRSASTKAALIARAVQDGLVDVYEL